MGSATGSGVGTESSECDHRDLRLLLTLMLILFRLSDGGERRRRHRTKSIGRHIMSSRHIVPITTPTNSTVLRADFEDGAAVEVGKLEVIISVAPGTTISGSWLLTQAVAIVVILSTVTVGVCSRVTVWSISVVESGVEDSLEDDVSVGNTVVAKVLSIVVTPITE